MDITIDRDSAVPVYRQISQRIRDLILSGRLPQGFRLPPERRLAEALGVNRTTVLAAYRELKADGLLGAHVGRGTEVVPPPATATAPAADGSAAGPVAPPPLPWRQLGKHEGLRGEDPLLRDLLESTERRDAISLAVGLPAADLVPVSILRALQNELWADTGAASLMHAPTEGLGLLRDALADHMTSRGAPCDASGIMVTSGSQQALDLVARAFIEPGDLVIVEEPSYFGALSVFARAGARLAGVPVDAHGMRTDVLAALLARQRPKLIYTLPTFQNPSGSVMSLERRRQLLALAYRHQVPLVEDDPYSELRYEGAPLPSLRALDPHGYVIYASSFSKILCPGLRLGWIAAPRAVVRQLTLVKQAIDLHASTPAQWLALRFLERGHLEPHLRTLRGAYAARRDALLGALAPLAGLGVTWTRPEGGFYAWCRLPKDTSMAQLLGAAANHGVSFLPGTACFTDDPGTPAARLCFTAAPEGEIREGIARFGRALIASRHQPVPGDLGLDTTATRGTRAIV